MHRWRKWADGGILKCREEGGKGEKMKRPRKTPEKAPVCRNLRASWTRYGALQRVTEKTSKIDPRKSDRRRRWRR